MIWSRCLLNQKWILDFSICYSRKEDKINKFSLHFLQNVFVWQNSQLLFDLLQWWTSKMDRSPKTSSFLCVVAIDIGTTYSGFAFSFIDEPFSISCRKWVPGTSRLMSEKTATSILLSPHGEFSAFGFEAEDQYTSLLQDDKHEGWMLFSRFKMMLFENKVS